MEYSVFTRRMGGKLCSDVCLCGGVVVAARATETLAPASFRRVFWLCVVYLSCCSSVCPTYRCDRWHLIAARMVLFRQETRSGEEDGSSACLCGARTNLFLASGT